MKDVLKSQLNTLKSIGLIEDNECKKINYCKSYSYSSNYKLYSPDLLKNHELEVVYCGSVNEEPFEVQFIPEFTMVIPFVEKNNDKNNEN